MTSGAKTIPRFSPVGERALLMTFEDVLRPEAHLLVRAMDAHLSLSPLPGVLEWIPAYTSLLVLYEPLLVQLTQVRRWLEVCLASLKSTDTPPPRQVEILVNYGRTAGPDLSFVAEYHGLTQAEVVAKHSGQTYSVGMMGFMPGFAYLLGLDAAIATPRLKTPRISVPAGSVGIAGDQTGIYPLESPGGWQLIGRTDQVLFDPLKEPYFTLSPGDQVRFIPAKDGILP